MIPGRLWLFRRRRIVEIQPQCCMFPEPFHSNKKGAHTGDVPRTFVFKGKGLGWTKRVRIRAMFPEPFSSNKKGSNGVSRRKEIKCKLLRPAAWLHLHFFRGAPKPYVSRRKKSSANCCVQLRGCTVVFSVAKRVWRRKKSSANCCVQLRGCTVVFSVAKRM